MSHDVSAWLVFARFPLFGAVRIKRISDTFSDMNEALQASSAELSERTGMRRDLTEAFVSFRSSIHPEQELALLSKHRTTVITCRDDRYPPLLQALHDPPAILFLRGAPLEQTRRQIAMVGSRKPSSYGKEMATWFARELASSGIGIVSGLAQGIDAAAHRSALDVSGYTIAVLGSGVDSASLYPSSHLALAENIVGSGGTLLSEFPLGTKARKQHFPYRNRVIAGLSHATLVVEAAAKSGSLITARAALEAGRDVLAVPGPIPSPLSEGPHNLIKMGAGLVASPEDVLQTLDPGATLTPAPSSFTADSKEEALIYATLRHEPLHSDEIIRATGLPAPVAASTLTLMEMKGSARHVGGRCYVRGS